MQRNIASGFEDSFRRHLAVEQRRAVLDTIAHELNPDTTLGDIVDAAQDLGWADGLGELCLADLAVALFGDASPAEPVAAEATLPRPPLPLVDSDDDDDSDELADSEDEDEDADTDDDTSAASEDDDDEPAARSGRKPSSLDRAVDRIEKTLAAARKVRSKKAAAKVAGKKLAKAAARIPTPAKPVKGKAAAKAAPAKPAAPVKAVKAGRAPVEEDEDEDDDTEAMSLDQAAKLLVPLVRKLREATMQDLEEQTKMGRRKLRFHIGQLVKHGKLRRHGMGRGTCYTVK